MKNKTRSDRKAYMVKRGLVPVDGRRSASAVTLTHVEPTRDPVADGIARRARRVAGDVAHDDYLKKAQGLTVTHSPTTTPVMDVNEDGETVAVLTIGPLGKGPLGHRLWGFTCPGCGVTFHRTSLEKAQEWAADHTERYCPR